VAAEDLGFSYPSDYIVRTSMDNGGEHTGEKAMSIPVPESGQLRTENINLRATQSQKALIDRAAEAQGRSRSDFILEAACREAESVLLDPRYFYLDDAAFQRFTAMLDAPPKSNPRLARLLKRNAPWDEPHEPQPTSLPAPCASPAKCPPGSREPLKARFPADPSPKGSPQK